MNNTQFNRELAQDIARFQHDPLGYVLYAFAWEEGELRDYKGPRKWQKDLLTKIGDQLKAGGDAGVIVQEAIASGHGIGKSALVSWLILWGLSTMEDTRIVVTANTETQLQGKTFPELRKWHRLSINSHWFKPTATSIFSTDDKHEKTWRADAVTWSENNTEAFAGLHNKGKRIILLFDEASAIADAIWEVAEGALTDENTEIIWCAFGNPTRNTGRFRECFGRLKHRWGHQHIDSREVDGTNKKKFEEWVHDYGEDSDFVRVRVRGMFPSASDLQFIPTHLVREAMERESRSMPGDPLVMALDIARGGADNCVFAFRRGYDGREVKPIVIPGSEARDSMKLASKAALLCEEKRPDYFFYDGTGVGGPVGDRIKQLGFPVIEIQFGGASPDRRYANMRTFMWSRLKEWLEQGGALPNDPELELELTSVEFKHNKRDQLILESKEEMKERGLASPDKADAFAMLLAQPVMPTLGVGSENNRQQLVTDWDPYTSA